MKTLLSIVLAVLALCSTGLAQKSVIRPPHPLRVFNGTGDGSYPFGHVQEISAPETLNGSNFFMWITIQGGYSIANPRSRTTTVRTLGHPMAVAAIYANAKVWYPDADEPPENQTELSVGLFLPKKPVPEPSAMIFLPKKPGPERRQMMLKATLEMGELGMGHENRIFEYLGFGLDWFPQQEGIWHSDDVEFYDSPSGRTRLTRGQHLSLSGSNIPYITEPTPIYASRTDSPTSKSRISSTVSRNLSVWYEPKWTTSDMAPRTPGETPREAPKMYVSTPLESVFGNTETWHSYSTVKSVPSVLLPVEVKEVWSDQITGVEANGFPDKTGPNEYPYIFMGATSATTFKVKVKLAAEIPAAVRSQILFRWASEGVLGEFLPETGTSTFSDGATVQLSSNFNINVGRERFLVWAFDENKNGQIDFSESETLIKMPHIRRGVSTSIPCKFIPIAQTDYEDNKETLLGWASAQLIQIPVRNSARHLIAFCNGTVPTYAGSEATTIKRNETGLTHPVGVEFTPTSNPGVSFKATISKDHDLSKKLIRSNALRSWLAGEFNSVADEIRADIIQERRNGNPAALLSYSIAAKEKSLAFGIIDPDLLLCLGKVTFENPTIDFDVDMYGFVSDVKVSGLANDLYDFDHEGEELLAYPARKASEVQAGFPSLGVGGKVFKTQIELGGGNPYSDPDLTPYTFFPY